MVGLHKTLGPITIFLLSSWVFTLRPENVGRHRERNLTVLDARYDASAGSASSALFSTFAWMVAFKSSTQPSTAGSVAASAASAAAARAATLAWIVSFMSVAASP